MTMKKLIFERKLY